MGALFNLGKARAVCEWLALLGASGDCYSSGCNCLHVYEVHFKACAALGAFAVFLVHMEERRRAPFHVISFGRKWP